MLTNLYRFLISLFGSHEPIRLTIVRRYEDANGSFVGELYRERREKQRDGLFISHEMIGVSLDTLPLDSSGYKGSWHLDTEKDFLAPILPLTVRVGASEPKDNDKVRKMVRHIPKRRIVLAVQNRFIEYVVARKA